MNAGALLDEWVKSFVEGRYEDGQALFAEDGISEEVGTGRTFKPSEGPQNAKAWKAAFPDAQGSIESRVVSGNQAVGEIVWTGTNMGPLNGMPATGKQVRARAVVVLQEENGKIKRLRHYIDIAGMMAQLGAMPGMAQATRTAAT